MAMIVAGLGCIEDECLVRQICTGDIDVEWWSIRFRV